MPAQAVSTPLQSPISDSSISNTTTFVRRPSTKKYRAPRPPIPVPVSPVLVPVPVQHNIVVHNDTEDTNISNIDYDDTCNISLKPKENGRVLAAAARLDSPRNTDPALMSIRERKALFEKNKGDAILPKAPITTPLPNISTRNVKPVVNSSPKTAAIHRSPLKMSSFTGVLNLLPSRKAPQTTTEEIVEKAKRERDIELQELQNRYKTNQAINRGDSETRESDDLSTENSPLMNSKPKFSTSDLSHNVPSIISSQNSLHVDEISRRDEFDAIVSKQPDKRRSSVDSAKVISVLEDVRKVHINGPRVGGLYPNLSDIESRPTSCAASLNNSSDSAANEKVDTKEQDWGNTSFGMEMLKAVEVTKSKYETPKKNNKVKRKSNGNKHDSSTDSSNNDALNDLLDDLSDAEYPTPPKHNKSGTVASNSFCYKKGSDLNRNEKFKSPLKTPPFSKVVSKESKPLVHTVSFYRQQQNRISQLASPAKVVKHEADNRSSLKQKEIQQAKKLIHDVRLRIKELNDEANKQSTIISQASQALNLCASTIEFSGSTEQAEGERLLLLATHRRQAFLHEAQRLQVEGLSNKISHRFDVTIKDLKLPLRDEYMKILNSDSVTGHYFVCLIKCQERVIATSLKKTRPGTSYILFQDQIKLEGLDSDFKVMIEVYALQAGKEVLPHDIKYHIATKKSGKLATPRKGIRGADLRSPMPITSPGGPGAVRSPSLLSHGYCIFSLNQATRSSFTLSKTCASGPLEGSLQLNLSCEKRRGPQSDRPPKSGFLTMFEEIGGFGAWHRRWCVLSGTDLSYWKYPDHQNKKTPIGSLDLTTTLSEKVEPAPRDICARAYTLLLDISTDCDEDSTNSLTIVAPGRRRYLLAADTKIERDEWAKAFNDILSDVRDF